MPVTGLFYHTWTGPGWREVAGEFAAAIDVAGVPGDLTVGIIGDGRAQVEARAWWQVRAGPRPLSFVTAETGWEPVTLAAVRAAARQYEVVFYGHTKGLLSATGPYRKMLTTRLIGGWRQCVGLLDGVDVVGCNWHPRPVCDPPMMAGNWWWARGAYIAGLPEPVFPDRTAADGWIGLGDPAIADLGRGADPGALKR